MADAVEMKDRIHLSLGTEGSPLGDSHGQLVVSRLTNKYNPLRFASEYAETVPTKIIDRDTVELAKKEIDRITSVVDRVESVDHFGEVYGLARTWPHTHVDEPRSFNKFRKQVLKPSVATETTRIAVRRSRVLLYCECVLVRS